MEKSIRNEGLYLGKSMNLIFLGGWKMMEMGDFSAILAIQMVVSWDIYWGLMGYSLVICILAIENCP